MKVYVMIDVDDHNGDIDVVGVYPTVEAAKEAAQARYNKTVSEEEDFQNETQLTWELGKYPDYNGWYSYCEFEPKLITIHETIFHN